MIHMGGGLRKVSASFSSFPAQGKVCSELRLGSSGFYPARSWTIEWFGLDGTLRIIQFQAPCCEQCCHPLCENLQEWSWHNLCYSLPSWGNSLSLNLIQTSCFDLSLLSHPPSCEWPGSIYNPFVGPGGCCLAPQPSLLLAAFLCFAILTLLKTLQCSLARGAQISQCTKSEDAQTIHDFTYIWVSDSPDISLRSSSSGRADLG